MTKEEAINILQEVINWRYDSLRGHPGMSYIAEAVEIILSKPSLPSNLDEAADAYSENILANGEDMFDAIADGFKAGSEWMAGQGETFETIISNFAFLPLPELNIQADDKVIVQIRKCDE